MGATGAEARYLKRVGEVSKSRLLGNPRCPILDGRCLKLFNTAAAPTPKVVVMNSRSTLTVEGFAVFSPHNVDLVAVSHLAQLVVHGGEADRFSSAPDGDMEVLSGGEHGVPSESRFNRLSLPGSPNGGQGGVGHL